MQKQKTLNNPFANINPPKNPFIQEQKKKRRKKYLIILLILLLLMPTGWFVKDIFIGGDSPIIGYDKPTNQRNIDLTGVPKEERKAILNQQVKDYEICMTVFPKAVFKDGGSEGSLRIANLPINNYPQLVEIYTSDTKTLLFSGVIDLGKEITSAKLLVDLPKGEYDSVAYCSNIDPETGKKLGTGKSLLTIVVEN